MELFTISSRVANEPYLAEFNVSKVRTAAIRLKFDEATYDTLLLEALTRDLWKLSDGTLPTNCLTYLLPMRLIARSTSGRRCFTTTP